MLVTSERKMLLQNGRRAPRREHPELAGSET